MEAQTLDSGCQAVSQQWQRALVFVSEPQQGTASVAVEPERHQHERWFSPAQQIFANRLSIY
jgi:hypothetical protein